MNTNQQCWACRGRRIRCDSQQPSCGKCILKGINCPGYSSTRPIRWRPPRVSTAAQPTTSQPVIRFKSSTARDESQKCENNKPVPSPVALVHQLRYPSRSYGRRDDVAPLSIVMDTITYYNARISPDLSALESTFGFITVSDWQELALTGRHLYVCIVAMHKAIQRAPQAFVDSVKLPSHPMAKNDPGALNLAMLHHHQASAAHSMQGQIEKVTAAEPDPRIIGNLALFLSVNIMESAYGRWHAHLQGAKALIDFWRHTDLDLPRSCGFGYFNLVMADIYSTTTSPSKHLSPSTVSYHSTYLDEIDRLQIFSFDSFTPVPKEMIITAISVNIHRARATNDTLEICEGIETSASGILEYARAFSPAIWAVEATAALAETNPSPTPNPLRDVNNLDSWTALAQSFQSATVLYLIWSIPPDERVGGTEAGTWAAARSWAYATLTTAIHDLFERRQKKGSHYKFILWSMLMAGLEAIVLSDHAELVFLCSNLRILTVDLGVSAMHEAADLLEKTWTRFENREMELELHHQWDEIFADAPLFLM